MAKDLNFKGSFLKNYFFFKIVYSQILSYPNNHTHQWEVYLFRFSEIRQLWNKKDPYDYVRTDCYV